MTVKAGTPMTRRMSASVKYADSEGMAAFSRVFLGFLRGVARRRNTWISVVASRVIGRRLLPKQSPITAGATLDCSHLLLR